MLAGCCLCGSVCGAVVLLVCVCVVLLCLCARDTEETIIVSHRGDLHHQIWLQTCT
jgi:hypothetical protein